MIAQIRYHASLTPVFEGPDEFSEDGWEVHECDCGGTGELRFGHSVVVVEPCRSCADGLHRCEGCVDEHAIYRLAGCRTLLCQRCYEEE